MFRTRREHKQKLSSHKKQTGKSDLHVKMTKTTLNFADPEFY